jgi:hypothetical protein
MAAKPMKPIAKSTSGRSLRYRPALTREASLLCQQHGYDDRQLAEVLDVSLATLGLWQERHPASLLADATGAPRPAGIREQCHWEAGAGKGRLESVGQGCGAFCVRKRTK